MSVYDRIRVEVSGELVIDVDTMSTVALDSIKAALTVPNEEREKASMLKTFGWWAMPETVALYRVEERRGGRRVICLPRGFSMALGAGMAGLGIEVEWIDSRTSVPAADDYYRPFVLRDYQLDAIAKMLRSEQGVYMAPAGSGKTTSCLGMASWANQRTLVIVDRSNLAEQWRSRAAQFFCMPFTRDANGNLQASIDGERTPGKIGEDVWEERDFTVALRQTLHSKGWGLDAAKWYETWGMVILDEVHHAASETLSEIARRVPSRYFFGVSATPSANETRGQIIHSLLGPIVAETTRQDLYDRKVLVRPTIEVRRGTLEADFWPDHDARFDKERQRWRCEKLGCSVNRKHSHRNNYQSCLKALVESPERNAAIADRIMSERGHVHLVPSRQKKHLDLIRKAAVAAGWPEDRIWMLRGEENAQGLSQQIADEVGQADEAVILSTVADEGLDIPPIDRIHLVFPLRAALGVIQTVGRVERVSPGKTEATVIDWHEPRVSCFVAQFEERLRTFRQQGYDVQERE